MPAGLPVDLDISVQKTLLVFRGSFHHRSRYSFSLSKAPAHRVLAFGRLFFNGDMGGSAFGRRWNWLALFKDSDFPRKESREKMGLCRPSGIRRRPRAFILSHPGPFPSMRSKKPN